MYEVLKKVKRSIYAARYNTQGEVVRFNPEIDGKLSVYDCNTGKPIPFFSRRAEPGDIFGIPTDVTGLYLVCPQVSRFLLPKWKVWLESFFYGMYTLSISPVYIDHFRTIGTVELMIVKEKSDE